MTELLFLRHGATEWNREKRLQGRSDIPLLQSEVERLGKQQLPGRFADFDWVASPLSRAYQTAEALRLSVETDQSVIEMNFGSWEGQTLASLRQQDPDAVAENEDRGWDFRPEGGESPRDVAARVQEFLKVRSSQHQKLGLVAHKGVIRVVMALATDWNMLGKPPVKFDWSALHLFRLPSGGALELLEANIPLEPRP